MSKLIGPEGNLEFQSGTDNYITGKPSSRQEGIFLGQLLRQMGRHTPRIAFAAAAAFAGNQAAITVRADNQTEGIQARLASVDIGETIRIQDMDITLLHGKMELDKRIGVAIMRQKGATLDWTKKIIENYFFFSKPLDEFKDKFYIADINLTGGMPDFGCNIHSAECSNWQLKNQMIDKVSQATGGGFQETIVLMYGGANGRGSGEIMWTKASLKTSAYVSLPENPGGHQRETLNHEIGGSFFGFQTNEEPCSVMNTFETRCPDFGVKQSEIVRRVLRGNPILRYVTPSPRLEILPASSVSVQGETRLLSGMDLYMFSPLGTTEIKWWVYPAPNIYTGKPDGHAIEMKYGDPVLIHAVSEAGQRILLPQMGVGNYVLLPDMTYTAGFCFQGSDIPQDWESSRWGEIETISGQKIYIPCEEGKFKTPKRFSDGITPISPRPGEVVTTSIPNLIWDNRDKDVFYYEVRASKDCTFNTDPKTATDPVWINLIHGGVTKPTNSWQTPQLELGAEYCWGARPRIQGDGTPVAWSETFTFSTPSSLKSASLQEAATGGWIADADYGNGIIGPSPSDMGK